MKNKHLGPFPLFAALVAAPVLCLLVACGAGGASGGTTNLEGAPEDLLKQILAEATASFDDDRSMPMVFYTEVTAESSQNQIGLSGTDFEKYVSSASVATAAIATFAHEAALIRAKDPASAAEIKKLVAAEGGYDSRKWICVMPEKSSVIESGSYVLLAVSRAEVVDAIVAAFTEAAGSVGERNDFFAFDGEMPEGGGMGLSLGGGPAPL